MLSRGQRLYVAFTCVATGVVAVGLYVLLVISELLQPGFRMDWVVACLRLVECCALFYFVTYLAAQCVYRRIGAGPELDYIAALSAENQTWLSGLSALVLLVAQCTLAFCAGGMQVSHVVWTAAAGVLLIHALQTLADSEQCAVDHLFRTEAPLRR